jgi:hypothetical protein
MMSGGQNEGLDAAAHDYEREEVPDHRERI